MTVVKMFAMMDFQHCTFRRFNNERHVSSRFTTEINGQGHPHVRLRRLLETPDGTAQFEHGLLAINARPFGFRHVKRLLHKTRTKERYASRFHRPTLPDHRHVLRSSICKLRNWTFFQRCPMTVRSRPLVNRRRLPAVVVIIDLHPFVFFSCIVFKRKAKLRTDDDAAILRKARIDAAFPCPVRHNDWLSVL